MGSAFGLAPLFYGFPISVIKTLDAGYIQSVCKYILRTLKGVIMNIVRDAVKRVTAQIVSVLLVASGATVVGASVAHADTYNIIRSTNAGITDDGPQNWFVYYGPDVASKSDNTLTAGDTSTRSWHVSDSSGNPVVGATVTMVVNKAYSNSTASGTLNGTAFKATDTDVSATAVTDSNGDVSFTLVNTDSLATRTQVAAWVNPNVQAGSDPWHYVSGDSFDIVTISYKAKVALPDTFPISFNSTSGLENAVDASGCSWYTSINDAHKDVNVANSATALQCTHEFTNSGIKLQKDGLAITSAAFPKVAFDLYASDASNKTIHVGLIGGTNPIVDLTVPVGWSHQVVDFSKATFASGSWSSSTTYTALTIKQDIDQVQGDPGPNRTFWITNIDANRAIASPTPSGSPSPSGTPTPTPVVKVAQTIGSVVTSVKVGKTITLPAKTSKALVIKWTTSTSKICSISAGKVKGLKIGTCKISGTNAGNTKTKAVTKAVTISVKK